MSSSEAPNDYYIQDKHTFCAGTGVWDSYRGTPGPVTLDIDETRVVEFDEHTTTTQHFTGWARADWADIYDEVSILRDNGDNEFYTLLLQYEDVVKTGEN